MHTQNIDSYASGLETLTRLLGADKAEAVRARFNKLSPAFETEAMSVVFGRTWSRDGLDPGTRALCSIAILAALGRQSGLRIVLAIALNNGITLEQITEALLQTAIYAGYPSVLDALGILESVMLEQQQGRG